MKVFQIVNGKCEWQTPYENVGETTNKYPKDCLFVEAPDYVFEGWGYATKDSENNPIIGDDRFIKPIAPEGFVYNDYTGEIIPESEFPTILEKAQMEKQEINKTLFAEFLTNHPLLYTDGKYYGVTMEDQTEISLNLNQYQLQVAAGVESPVLEWHAIHEGCQPWTVEDLTNLAVAISNYIYPWFRKMQSYKTSIFSATSKEEIDTIELVYKTEEEIAAELEAAKEETDTENKNLV